MGGGTIADQALSCFSHFQCQPWPHVYRGPESSLSSHSDGTGFWSTQDTKKNYLKSFTLSLGHLMIPIHPQRHFNNVVIEKRKPKQSEFEINDWRDAAAFPILSMLTMGMQCSCPTCIRILLSASEHRLCVLNTNIAIHHLVVHAPAPDLTQCNSTC